MKIDRPDKITIKTMIPDQKRQDVSEKNEFKNVLDDSINQSGKSTSSPDGKQALLIASLSGVPPMADMSKSDDFQKIEEYLNFFDDYIHKLGDPNFTLKDLATIIDKMATENDKISNLIDSLPEMDELKDIANEALMISSLEVEKFKRGDYLDS